MIASIYLFQVMILELIGTYLGWRLEIFALSSVLEIPVLTVLTFMATCLILYPLLKIRYVKNNNRVAPSMSTNCGKAFNFLTQHHVEAVEEERETKCR
ncbi:MAG TPA: hypothetical protein VJY36_02910 [Candidatus Bathyarchaeia archaeon]|nr:hypothetical protein [Candidatus Bathyarchaeia archaeon]